MKIFLTKKEAAAINLQLQEANQKVKALEKSAQFKDNKIRELMQSVQSLNADLDRWEPLANQIAVMVEPFMEQEMTLPKAGINLLKKYQDLMKDINNGLT
ncbi:MAG: hypothetical protein KAU20_03815 [Nanoarchaeota archaeon]|nr:hypothetical protein [Nanoarchaeota archaeon]